MVEFCRRFALCNLLLGRTCGTRKTRRTFDFQEANAIGLRAWQISWSSHGELLCAKHRNGCTQCRRVRHALQKIQLSKIKLAHSSATFQVRKHTFKASVACNGREVLHGTPNAPKKLCFEGKPRSRRRAHERSEVAARSREGGTAFRRVRPPIALAIASRPYTGR